MTLQVRDNHLQLEAGSGGGERGVSYYADTAADVTRYKRWLRGKSLV